MDRRWTVLVSGLVLALALPQAATAGTPSSGVPQDPDPSATSVEGAVRRVRAEADGALRVHRGEDGRVDFLASADGSGVLEPQVRGSERAAVADQLDRYGEAFGLDGSTSRAVVREEVPSSTGGTVVRADQVVDGVPVFGGQLVTSLDEDRSVVSVTAATTEAQQVPAPQVDEATAARTALAATAKAEHVPAGSLQVTRLGRRLYDPALVHTVDPGGTRPVWQLEVGNGSTVRETVLVGTGRGEVALRFDDAPGLDRVVCDNESAATLSSAQAVPVCSTPARVEGAAPTGVGDVDAAYENLGAVDEAYARLAGIDLTGLVGGASTGGRLTATVRWCYSDEDCPFENAFWDGRQMVFGAGYAGADDVVGHELTHGYVERTSRLFSFHQSGAVNESVADVVGEVVDHGHGTEDDSAWTIGEDLPGGGIRSLQDPASHGQPDSMTSERYSSKDVLEDGGDVHLNDGVGNKTAYLISQGGTFGGATVRGIDGSDPRLSKTGRLYLEVIPRLTSGAEYADLGRVLVSTCQQLAAAGTAGFTTTDCASVVAAVAATRLSSPPTDPAAAAPETPVACPSGYDVSQIARDDDGLDGFGWQLGPLWQRTTPTGPAPTYATSGSSSLFAWDPDPSGRAGLPSRDASSDATSRSFVVPDRPTYLHLHHAEVLEFDPATTSAAAQFYDGAQVLVQSSDGSGGWSTETSLPWVEGPSRTTEATWSAPVFAGDSHGYGSSRLDLSSLSGQTVRIVLRVTGDAYGSFLGWWVDDVRLYSCTGRAPGAVPSSFSTRYSGNGRVVVAWGPPTDLGSGIGWYAFSTSAGERSTTSATVRSASMAISGRMPGTAITVTPYNRQGVPGPSTRFQLLQTRVATTVPTTRVRRDRSFAVSATVTRAGTSTRVSGVTAVLQAAPGRTRRWHEVSRRTTVGGVARWTLRQRRTTSYRVLALGGSVWEPSTGPGRTVVTR